MKAMEKASNAAAAPAANGDRRGVTAICLFVFWTASLPHGCLLKRACVRDICCKYMFQSMSMAQALQPRYHMVQSRSGRATRADHMHRLEAAFALAARWLSSHTLRGMQHATLLDTTSGVPVGRWTLAHTSSATNEPARWRHRHVVVRRATSSYACNMPRHSSSHRQARRHMAQLPARVAARTLPIRCHTRLAAGHLAPSHCARGLQQR